MRTRKRARMENLVDSTTELYANPVTRAGIKLFSAQLVHWNVDLSCIKSCIPRIRLRRRHSANGRSLEHKPSNKNVEGLIRSTFCIATRIPRSKRNSGYSTLGSIHMPTFAGCHFNAYTSNPLRKCTSARKLCWCYAQSHSGPSNAQLQGIIRKFTVSFRRLS
jgi:hypothetical protein